METAQKINAETFVVSRENSLLKRIFLRFQEKFPKKITPTPARYWWFENIELSTSTEGARWRSWLTGKDINIIKKVMDGIKTTQILKFIYYPPTLAQFRALYEHEIYKSYGGSGVLRVNGNRFFRSPVEIFLLEAFHKHSLTLINDGQLEIEVSKWDKEPGSRRITKTVNVTNLEQFINAFLTYKVLWPIRLEELESFPLPGHLKDEIVRRSMAPPGVEPE